MIATVRAMAERKKIPESLFEENSIVDSRDGLLFPSVDEDGTSGRTYVRTRLKAGKGSYWARGEIEEQRDILPWGLWKLPEARSEGFLVITEGHTDTLTLWYHSFPALAIPGGTMTDKLRGQSLREITELLICDDGDKTGELFVESLLKKLSRWGWKGRAFVLNFRKRFGVDIKDASDLHCRDPRAFPKVFNDWLDELRDGPPAYDGTAEPSEPSTGRDEPLSSEPAIRIVTGEELLTHRFPPREYVLSPILETQGLCLIHGPTGVGKTYLSLTLAYAIATGSGLFENRWVAPKPRKILYIDGEMSGPVMQERLAQIVKGFENEPPSQDYLQIITPDTQPIGIPDFSIRNGQKILSPFLPGRELLILDNLSCLCRTGDENAAESWTVVQDWALALRRQGLSVIFIHHDGKNDRFGGRGTSKKLDVLNTSIALKRPVDYDQSEGLRVEVHFEKARSFHGDAAKGFEIALHVEKGAARWLWQPLKSVSRKDKVLVLHDQGKSLREIEKETGISKSEVGRIIKGLN